MSTDTTGLDPMEERLVTFATTFLFENALPAHVDAAKARVLDSIGVAMAAYLAPPSRIARRMAQPTAGPLKARVWGTDVEATPDAAAFANGVMVRYLDLNDAYRTRDAHHPSDYIPGVLAVAEALDASGADFIAAVMVAYEIMCRFTDVVPFNERGFDQPVTGGMATALACGRLLGLDASGMRDALALALVPNLCTYQTRAGELSMWKGCAGPNGARNGVFAALLAQQGMTGPHHPFDGVFGVWNQATEGRRYEVTLPRPGASAPGIVQTNIKTYPVRDSCQLPIRTALALRERLSGRAIDRLVIETYKSAHLGAVADPELWRPKTRETADHSMLFSVACALIDGRVTPGSFEVQRFLDDDVLALIGCTEVVVRDDFTAATPAIRNCRITAFCGADDLVAHEVLTLEEIERGMPFEEVERKFRTCVAHAFDRRRQDEILAFVARLDHVPSVRPLPALLAL